MKEPGATVDQLHHGVQALYYHANMMWRRREAVLKFQVYVLAGHLDNINIVLLYYNSTNGFYCNYYTTYIWLQDRAQRTSMYHYNNIYIMDMPPVVSR